jgi:hypothetical protein
MRSIQGTSEWREFYLPFNLMGNKPESVTLEINVVMPGKGTIELTNLAVSDIPPSIVFLNEWFDTRMAGMIGSVVGGIGGTLGGFYGALVGILCGFLVPRAKGRRLLTGMFVVPIIIGVILLIVGITVGVTALLCGQPYHVWYPILYLGCLGGFLVVIFSVLLPVIRNQCKQAELRKMQALDM